MVKFLYEAFIFIIGELLTSIIWALGFLLVFYICTSITFAAPSCLTKSEARDRWPRTHLYWHGEAHCWDNHQGGQKYRHYIRTPRIQEDKPYIDKRAYIAQAEDEAKPAIETKSDPWDSATPLKVKLIEFIEPAEAAPLTPVEKGATLPSLTPPPRASELIAVLGGAFSAILIGWIILFNRRNLHVKRSIIRAYQRTTTAGRKVLQACLSKGNKQSPIPEINIRDVIRRIERAGHDADLREVPTGFADPKPTLKPYPLDDSAIACWARSLRT